MQIASGRNMKRRVQSVLLTLAAILLGMWGCFEVNPISSGGAQIVVFVHWEDSPIQGKKVELLDSGEVKYTDKNGRVELTVQPGTHTVRVYDINRGGPCCGYIDLNVTVSGNESKVLDVVDCLPCV